MTEEELKDAVGVAEALLPQQISETLEDLIARERSLLDATQDSDMRAITLHNIAVLTAACHGYAEAAKQHAFKSAEPEKAGKDAEGLGVDEDAG